MTKDRRECKEEQDHGNCQECGKELDICDMLLGCKNCIGWKDGMDVFYEQNKDYVNPYQNPENH